ncbi:tyrosine-protein kinase receptor TYRO3 [Aulostomus maculatus]
MAAWTLFLLLMWTLDTVCDTQYRAEEVEIFHSDKHNHLGWTSQPRKQWNEISLRVDGKGPVPVLQTCTGGTTRTILSPWMERQAARHLLMDVAFAQEEEPSGQLGLLQVYVMDTDISLSIFRNGRPVLKLQTSRPFADTVKTAQIPSHLNWSRALDLGPISHKGFHLGFSYSAQCVLVTSIRLYYKICPEIVEDLVWFGRTEAGSEPSIGSCVEGALEVSPPFKECGADGVWGPLQGGCTCKPGHQNVTNACKACAMGFYKPAEDSGGCRLCPPHTHTQMEGSETCDCFSGFNRLPHDPDDLGCTKPPSAPVNVTALPHNESTLNVMWDPPHDWGGRQEVIYRVKCETQAEAGSRWKSCGGDVLFFPDSAQLNGTSISITGLNPQNDYRLSVQAWNHLSTQLGGLPPSSASITIQRSKAFPEVIKEISVVKIPERELNPAPQHQRNLNLWLIFAVILVSLLLSIVIPITVCVHRNSRKFRTNLDMELLPMNPSVTYRYQPQLEAVDSYNSNAPEEEGVVQLLGSLSPRLLASLNEVLVERDRLTLGKELGKGEFGSVYEGVFTSEQGMDMKVAVKTMRVGLYSQEDLNEFLGEAELMRSFHHDNVVGLLGVTLQREQDSPLPVPLVILPFMKHGDLRRFLIATRYGDIPMFVPHQSLLRFMIDIAAGMEYLSSQGFLHRDLAARNCMLADNFRVCVADFGLSKKNYSSNYYRQKVAIRVPIKWMALESLSESIYTTKSDVWSFGVTMWEIVSRGRTPYPGVHNHELLDLLLSGHRLKPHEECDQKLYSIMQSCWEKDPAQRPDFKELGEKLKGLLFELPVLEASQEANYINQGLEVASAAAAIEDPQTDSAREWGNLYLPAPVGAAAARDECSDEQDGYLMFIPGTTVR